LDRGLSRRRLDRAVAALARLVLRVFFRRLEVEGAERLPPRGPRLVVANHVNGLIDPLLVIAVGLEPRFLGKSTLWRILPLRPLLSLAGAIPVHRRQDPGADPARNLETFARCHEVLRDGGTIALFPEGKSHDEPALQPLKTGAARIVLEAEARCGPLGVAIVPLGLVYEDKASFRSRALVHVGLPLDPAPERALYAADPAGAVRALTARLDAALDEVTVSYASWDEARLIARGAELLATADAELPRSATLAASQASRRQLLAGYQELRRRHPEAVAEAAAAVDDYDRLLRALGLRDDQVAARYPAAGVARWTARTLSRLALRLPLAAIGTALNFLPYFTVRWIARRRRDDADLQATLKLFPALVLYPLTWTLAAALAGWWRGPWAAAVTAIAAPLTGWVALRFHEQRRRLSREARAYLMLRTRGRLAAELRARRAAVEARLRDLVALWREV
jgi:1-acyl-sn-glycerol-3-phosphate acyltransferase